jgi:hypothetical protein
MRIKWRLFWSYDVIKTQQWLSDQSNKGLILVGFNPILRIFKFDKTNQQSNQYMIIYDKKSNSCPDRFLEDHDYLEITNSKNYYILKQLKENPEIYPSYEALLNKNAKLKYIVGNILLFVSFIYFMVFTMILSSILSGNFSVEWGGWGGWDSPNTIYTAQEIILGIIQAMIFYSILLIILFSPFWMIYTYFKLNKANKALEKLCGNTKTIKFTIPTDAIIDKNTLSIYKKQGQIIKKTKIGWFYSPDIAEKWLEKMEAEGLNLLSMSNLGNSFYFIKGEPKKVKFHVDFQIKKNVNYLSINEENGWKLFFTSLTRYFAISVWSKEYDIDLPKFYSNIEDEGSHAKKFMITYASIYIFLGTLYAAISVLFGYTIWTIIPEHGIDVLLLSIPIMFTFSTILYFYYAYKVIRYYYRAKKYIL